MKQAAACQVGNIRVILSVVRLLLLAFGPLLANTLEAHGLFAVIWLSNLNDDKATVWVFVIQYFLEK